MNSEDIKLFDHNESAFQKLMSSLEKYPLAFIEHATGTGKSMILLKYLYLMMRHKRILFITLHYEMFDQLFGSQMATLNMSKSDFKKFGTLIYHNIIKHNMKELIDQYDCFVFDEAHHCGAPKWGASILELKNLVKNTPGKVMIGMTATGTRYLDDFLDVSEKYFDGKTVSKLSVSWAILNNLLPAPLYINSSNKCVEKIQYLKQLLKRVPKVEESKILFDKVAKMESKITKDSDVASVLKKYGVKQGEKYIVFCKDIKDLKQKMEEANGWFSTDIKMFQAHSGQNSKKNRSEINEFGKKREEISLMFAVDIFNEGFHIEDVDGILMFRKTKSPIIYFQQIGRALSFSLRKKQIKIFDFVDNISENDVINELYKEIISESKKLIKENPENKELYEEILSRFKIIDDTSATMDILNDLENKIKEEFFIKSKIEKAIMRLEEYRFYNPKSDFFSDVSFNKVETIYLKAFQYIINMNDYLTDLHIEKLSKLNIDFGKSIELDMKRRKRDLGEYKTYNELFKHKYEEFVSDYVKFFNINQFRPRFESTGVEQELYSKHRFYLSTLSRKKIINMISKFSFKSTVEEIILTGGVPQKEDIDEYLNYLREKIVNNLVLDNIEEKVLSRLKNAISVEDVTLMTYAENSSSLEYKINKAINILKRYKDKHPDEDFSNVVKFHTDIEILKAVNTIYKYAKKINNNQFKLLLELGIKLPDVINMTMEERLQLLKQYSSIYEKEQAEKNNIITIYTDFVKKNGRRPNIKDKNEQRLAVAYYDQVFKTTVPKLRSIVIVLKTCDIPLSFFEKALVGETLTTDEITSYFNKIKEKINKNDVINPMELKVLRSLYNNQNYCNKEELALVIKTQKYAIDFEELLADDKKTKNEKIGYMSTNHKFMSKRMLESAINHGIEVPQSLIDEVDNLGIERTIYEREQHNLYSFLLEFETYIKTNKKRPIKDSTLDRQYREYISRLHTTKLNGMLKLLTDNGISLIFEEKVLLGELNNSMVDEYIKELEKKPVLDSLERRVYNLLLNNLDNRASYMVTPITKRTDNSIQSKIYNSLIDRIKEQPLKKIDDYFEISYLNSTSINRLRRYRDNILANIYLQRIADKLKNSKMTMNEILTEEEMNVYLHLNNSTNLEEYYYDLIKKIKNIDYKNSFYQAKVGYQDFIDRYIGFVTTHEGIRPDEMSTNEEEQRLASEYKSIIDILSKSDLSLIENAISNSIKKSEEDSFYENFINFILTNERFPCMNAIDENELKLANIFISMNKKLSKEEQSYISILRKKFAANTMRASKEFSTMRDKSLKKIN